MKVYRTLEELRDAPFVVYNYIRSIMGNNASLNEIEQTLLSIGLKIEDAFDYYLGGYPCVLEEVTDLEEIKTFTPTVDGKDYLSLYRTADYFDVIERLEGGWVAFCNITNDSGGNTFFIPDWMMHHCVYIAKSIEMTNENNT